MAPQEMNKFELNMHIFSTDRRGWASPRCERRDDFVEVPCQHISTHAANLEAQDDNNNAVIYCDIKMSRGDSFAIQGGHYSPRALLKASEAQCDLICLVCLHVKCNCKIIHRGLNETVTPDLCDE